MDQEKWLERGRPFSTSVRQFKRWQNNFHLKNISTVFYFHDWIGEGID
jgi:hypothetical protein